MVDDQEKKEEEVVEQNSEELVIQTIREEYERQLQEQKAYFEEQIKQIKEEAEQRTINQIKALMSGRTIEEQEPVPQEMTDYEMLLEETRKKLRG